MKIGCVSNNLQLPVILNPVHGVNNTPQYAFKVKPTLGRSYRASQNAIVDGIMHSDVNHLQWIYLSFILAAKIRSQRFLAGVLGNEMNKKHFRNMSPDSSFTKKSVEHSFLSDFQNFGTYLLGEHKEEMVLTVENMSKKLHPSGQQVSGIKDFYLKAREEAISSLTDGTGHKPHYSLRTLCRALAVASRNQCSNINRSLYESFCLSFLTQLDRKSHPVVTGLIKKHILRLKQNTGDSAKKNSKLNFGEIPKPQQSDQQMEHTQVEGYWVPQGGVEPLSPDRYIITSTVRENLKDLVRIVSIGRFPVLLQGETSVGKTSLVTYLATLTGNNCVRINNHEHTDLQEYIGSYSPDASGKLIFKEGILVSAMRSGNWIILDELNLAPSDVLEALNRLLDDNRELFIPETQELVKAHPRFMLFATQNPPGLYGGRKVLSRAFRNRFVELHFDEIPSSELEIILHKRCEVPLSYSKKMVGVLQELQNMRRGTNLFQGRQSFITLRDLFRWAERYRLAPKQTTQFYDWDQHLADEGYLVLSGKVRLDEEADLIRKVLEKRLKKKIIIENLFTLSEETSSVTRPVLEKMSSVVGFEHVVWTQDMRRLYVLLGKSLGFCEPVLLVGETGCGKTTVCQMIAEQERQELFTVNCHMHTEGADFLGGLRPVRNHIDEDDERLFEWVDGPLIKAMYNGGMFLADEISLADDSVLERLNSVLEPERTLVLAEKGVDDSLESVSPEIIVANKTFRLVGTMNPGGDYGKKELSPALRNRFTEIWCPKVEIERYASDVLSIIEHNVKPKLMVQNKEETNGIGNFILKFLEYFTKTELGKKCTLSIRDLLSWVSFINKVTEGPSGMDVGLAYIHGACLVLLDGLGSGLTGSGVSGWKQLRSASLNFLYHQVWQLTGIQPNKATLQEDFVKELTLIQSEELFGIEPFVIKKGSNVSKDNVFTFKAPRTCINLLRVLRGLQLKRPLLLEGSPGVGKTSLVVALANASGNDIIRINLSEQTDVSDLFGADLPVEGAEGGKFAWRDGPLLQALRNGSWIVLDELNLASQSVLEGLNACFDHRGEIFVPELGRSFQVKHQTTKIFACQNPQFQGGARKGLPKSFLNRFTQVHVEPLSSSDLEFILGSVYPKLPSELVSNMVKFNAALVNEILEEKLWGQKGGPWELNLRDLFRWCDVLDQHQDSKTYNPGEFLGLIYSDRMRTYEDKMKVFEIYKKIFGDSYPSYHSSGRFHITQKTLQIGHSLLTRNEDGHTSMEERGDKLYLMHQHLPTLESLITCINMNWMTILVGGSGTGKTSLVKLLAQLSGKSLMTLTVNSDMDVTELLGGFEQVDYGRCLGEIVISIEILLHNCLRTLLINGKDDHAAKILKTWDEFLCLRNDSSPRTTLEEVDHFEQECKILLYLLEMLLPNIQDIEKTSKKLNIQKNIRDLLEKVKDSGGLSGGGTFEWQDSILVKAVRDGGWLLIDNVNVCSPSVLDRLNGLLEPGGVLTISERGVVGEAVPCIVKHPDFRLFLVMDPQLGEISRAMRNRGLEICMTRDWTEPEDIRSLMQSGGLIQPNLQNSLILAHDAVCSVLFTYERPGMPHLIQCASVIAQLLQYGHSPLAAFSHALTIVYVRSCGKLEVQKKIYGAIQEFTKEMTFDYSWWPQYEHQVLSIGNINYSSSLAQIQLTTSLLHSIMLVAVKPELAVDWISTPLPPLRDIPRVNALMPCLAHCLLRTPIDNWALMAAWTNKLCNYLPSDFDNSNTVLRVFDEAISNVHNCTSIALHSKLKHTHCCDPRFNIQCIDQEDNWSNDLTSLSNKINFWLWRVIHTTLHEPDQSYKVENDKKVSGPLTILQLSRALCEGKASKAMALHPSVSLLTPLMVQIDNLLRTLINNVQVPLLDQEWEELVTAVQWRDRLYKLCDQVVNKTNLQEFVAQLTLHWQWLEEEFINKVPVSWSDIVSKELLSLVSQLHSVFQGDYGPVHKLASDLRYLVSPAPFTCEEAADSYKQFIKLAAVLTPDPASSQTNIFLASPLGKDACELLMQLAIDSASSTVNDMKHVSMQLTELEEKLNKNGVMGGCKPESNPDVEKMIALDVQTWPLQDLIANLALSWSRSCGTISNNLLNMINQVPGISNKILPAIAVSSYRDTTVHAVHIYLALTNSTAIKDTKAYLNFGNEEIVSDEKYEEEIMMHPMSSMLTYILSGGEKKFSLNNGAMEEVILGLHSERLEQLHSIRATLWNNMSMLSSQETSYEASYLKSSSLFITSVLKAICGALSNGNFNDDCNLAVVSSVISRLLETEHKKLPQSSINALKALPSAIQKLPICIDDLYAAVSASAHCVVLVGALHGSILSHMEVIDPAQRSMILLNYKEKQVEEMDAQLLVSSWMDALRGCPDNLPDTLLHPHIPLIIARKDKTQEDIIELSQHVAHRPVPSTYHQLMRDVTHFVTTVFDANTLLEITKKITSPMNATEFKANMKQVNVTLASCDNFIQSLVKSFPLYRDLIYPLLHAVVATCEALGILASIALQSQVNSKCSTDLTKKLSSFASYPIRRSSSSSLEVINNQLSVVQHVMPLLNENYSRMAKSVANVTLHSSLLECLRVAVSQGYLDSATVEFANKLMEQVMGWWRQQEEEKARKAEEEESYYKYKSRTLAINETEEEEIEREFNEEFPNFDKDFENLNGPDLNSEKMEENNDPIDSESSDMGQLTEDQLRELTEVHRILFTSFTATAWRAAPAKPLTHTPQLIPAALLRLQAVQGIMNAVGPVCGTELDRALLGAHILGNHSSCDLLSNAFKSKLISYPYDIYHDPNPDEAIKGRPLLEAVKERVNELLDQWPSHPTLEMINKVSNMVLSFPVTSSLMKFIVGLETVLEKAQEWERNAHAGVSLMTQLEAITHQIIEWRQMELHAWKSCLDTVEHRVALEGRKWWTHLYNILKGAASGTVQVMDLLNPLKQFFEGALLGDFKVRLDMLMAFHCSLAMEKSNENLKNVLALTWNIIQYYSQFVPVIKSVLDKAKKPIEKEVKNYVKIARWNDINYFSVRESVVKSHKTLHRHMRTWKKKLTQSCTSYFKDEDSDLKEDHTGEWDKSLDIQRYVPPKANLPKVPGEVAKIVNIRDESLLMRLPLLTPRCHQLTCQTLNKLPYEDNIDAIEDLSTNIIENYHSLQSAATKADINKDTNVRLKQLKSVMQRRRDGLAQLIKTLSEMGVSYTKGNTLWKDRDLDYCLIVPPVDINVAHSKEPCLKSSCESWSSCEKYFHRCVSRLTQLEEYLQKPHADLGPELIKRLKGIPHHLMLFVRDQRKSLGPLSDLTCQLRQLISNLETSKNDMPSRKSFMAYVRRLHSLIVSLSLTVTEVITLLSTWSEAESLLTIEENISIPSRDVLEEGKRDLLSFSDNLNNVKETTTNIVNMSHIDTLLVSPQDVEVILVATSSLKDLSLDLVKIISLLSPNSNKQSCLTSQLNDWLNEYYKSSKECAGWANSQTDYKNKDVNESHKLVESCINEALLAVESLYKRHTKAKNINEKSSIQEEEENNSLKDLISEDTVNKLLLDISDLRLEKVVVLLEKVMNDSEHPEVLSVVKASLPLLNQYKTLCENTVSFSVHCSRSISKLLSVLLAIFQQLALKGFCKPQEMEDDDGTGEGAPQKFQEMDGTGLGEGDGKKDVSDRIESEDQLEAALKEGEEEQSGDTDLKEEEQGIEMGDDFEGKMQDIERKEEDNDGEDSDDNEESDELDKQMGETEKGADKLDEKLWGQDDDKNEDENEDENEGEEGQKEDEDGPGDGEQTESQMVAKDDNKSKQEDSKEREKRKKPEEMEEDTREFPEEKQEEEYDDNFTDQHGGEDGEQQQEQNEENPMDLPDDLNLDGGEEHDNEGEEENDEKSDPMDIEEKGLFPEEERESQEKEESKLEDDDDDEKGENNSNENKNKEESEDEEGDKKDDNRKVGTEEDEDNKTEEEEKSDGCEDQQNRTDVEAALDTTEGSKDQTKEKPKDESAGDRKEDEEEMQEETGQVGEQTEDMSGVGESESRTQDDAHKGESTALVTEKNAHDQHDMRKPRKPGEANEDRALGNEDEITRGLMTKDSKSKDNNKDESNDDNEKDSDKKRSDTYEHIKHAQESFDAQTIDAATQEQAAERPAPANHGEDDNKDEDMTETPMDVDDPPDDESMVEKEALQQESSHNNDNTKQQKHQGSKEAQEGETRMDTEGEAVLESIVQRPPESFFHTLLDMEDTSLFTDSSTPMFEPDVEATRARLMRAELSTEAGSASWQQHEERVAPLALQLCEQLRLILEPTQAARLRGDYRTGKRLNMRKVIPYIASQFRKDKIWLRRTMPNKRTYQILLAVDDSESMAVMQARGLACESVALVTKALTLLEAGQVGVVSFGETTQILHPMDQPFSKGLTLTISENSRFKKKPMKYGH
ncbi:unnamed protein product, partial [Meganyctiphanes norvegica]